MLWKHLFEHACVYGRNNNTKFLIYSATEPAKCGKDAR
jgi:hypothetical protein